MSNIYEVVKFVDEEFELEVRTDKENETVWLTQEEMAYLFNVDRTRILRHIYHIYSEDELDEETTCAESAQVQIEGNRKTFRKEKNKGLKLVQSDLTPNAYLSPFETG